MLTAASIRAFLDRSWSDVERSKQEHWARVLEERGASGALRLGHALYLHARSVQPHWPSPADREQDLADHLELKRRLAVIADALSGR